MRFRQFHILLLAPILALLAGCSSQDFGSSMGSISDMVDSGKDYVPKKGATDDERARQLASALLTWQQQRGVTKEDYTVGPDDVLEITIYNLEQPGEPSVHRLEISQLGMIGLPLVGEMKVSGLNVRQIENRVTQAYLGDYLQDPRISVVVATYHSAPVVVTGAVGKPGIYYLQHNNSSVLEILSMAEGLSPSAGQQLLIVRNGAREPTNSVSPAAMEEAALQAAQSAPEDSFDYDFSQFPLGTNAPAESAAIAPAEHPAPDKPAKGKSRWKLFGHHGDTSASNAVAEAASPGTNAPSTDVAAMQTPVEADAAAGSELITVDLSRLLDEGDIRLNLDVQGGDIVTVPGRKLKQVFVLGYVQRAGAYEVERGHDTINALQAVAMAGGLSASARAQNSFLIRESEGRRQVLPLDLRKIAKGIRPPVFMEAGDTLVVGSDWLAKIGEFVKPSVSAGASYAPVP